MISKLTESKVEKADLRLALRCALLLDAGQPVGAPLLFLGETLSR